MRSDTKKAPRVKSAGDGGENKHEGEEKLDEEKLDEETLDEDEEDELALVRRDMLKELADSDVKVEDICAGVKSYLEETKKRGRAHNALARSKLHVEEVVADNEQLLSRGLQATDILRQAGRLQRLQFLTSVGHFPGDLQISNYLNYNKVQNEGILAKAGKAPTTSITSIPAEVLSAFKK